MNDLESRFHALEERVEELEDHGAITNLRYRYHVAVNEKRLDELPSLFEEDARVDFEGIGAARGRQEIDALYRDLVGESPFIKQFIHNHLITLAGDEATGLSYLDARTVRDGESVLVAARFDDEYVRSAGAWRFRSLRLRVFFAVPVQAGWAEAIEPLRVR
jgi:hypothetical protein